MSDMLEKRQALINQALKMAEVARQELEPEAFQIFPGRPNAMELLLDAAHAYGLAVGRSGFVPHNAYAHSPQSLRASIDTIGRAVDDHESRLAQVEFGVEQWKEQGLLERIGALESHRARLVGRVEVLEAALEEQNGSQRASLRESFNRCRELEAALERERAEHARTKTLLACAQESCARYEEVVKNMLRQAPTVFLEAIADEPPF